MTETKIPLVDSHLNTVIEPHEAVGILHQDSFPLASPTAPQLPHGVPASLMRWAVFCIHSHTNMGVMHCI